MNHGANIIEVHPAKKSPTLGATLKAVADDIRLQILRVMAKDSFNVTELCEILGTRQSALSHHLKILTEASFLCNRACLCALVALWLIGAIGGGIGDPPGGVSQGLPWALQGPPSAPQGPLGPFLKKS